MRGTWAARGGGAPAHLGIVAGIGVPRLGPLAPNDNNTNKGLRRRACSLVIPPNDNNTNKGLRRRACSLVIPVSTCPSRSVARDDNGEGSVPTYSQRRCPPFPKRWERMGHPAITNFAHPSLAAASAPSVPWEAAGW